MVFKLRNQQNQQATPVPPGEHSVGREDFNYICIDEPSVSRRHARLINSNEGIFVEDLGSSNGTAVRGQYIQGLTQVSFGDLVYFGQVPFAIEPEVPGEQHEIPVAGLKNPKPERTGFRHDTEKLPVGHIQFEDSVPAITPPEDDIDADKLDIQVHDPVVHTRAPTDSNPQVAPSPQLSPQAAPRPKAAAKGATPQLPAAPILAAKAAAAPATASPTPTPAPSLAEVPAYQPPPTPSSAPAEPAVNLNTAIGLAFVAGFSLGCMAGLLLALAMN